MLHCRCSAALLRPLLRAALQVVVNLAVDPRKTDQMVRAAVILPSGTGRRERICVFARGADAEAAKEAGGCRHMTWPTGGLGIVRPCTRM